MERLILIRHGETDKNIAGRVHSSHDPEELNEAGKQQLLQTVQRLKELSPVKIYSSKEKRAVQSAELLAQGLGLSTEAIDDMQERDWGELSGMAWSEIKATLDPMTLEERYTYIPPQGESWKEVEERLITVIGKILNDCPDKTVVVVTHGGAIRILMPYLLGAPKEESFKYDPDNASLTIFDHENGKFISVTVNDTSHLGN